MVNGSIVDGYSLVFTMLQYEGGKQRRALVSTMTEDEISEMLLPVDQLTRFANAFTNAGRIAILYALAKGPLTSAELSTQTGLQGGQLYHHLRELIHSGMVVSEERNSYELSPVAGKPAFLGLNLLAKGFYHAAKAETTGDD
ncbi:MAG: ArsR/SmtB family transcription factor [Bacillota bacterium]